MLLGLLSDSHDQSETLIRAINLLRQGGAEFLIHCGDICAPNMLDHLAGIPSAFVWGNCDYDRMGLQRYADSLGIACYGSFGEFEFDGNKFAVLHGDDAHRKARVLGEQKHDYLLHGHTHVPDDRTVGKIRVINPGALFRTKAKRVAILDASNGVLKPILLES